MLIDYSRLVIAISSHNRPTYLQRVLDSWSTTAPDYKHIYVFVHHPDGANGVYLPPKAEFIHTGRPPEHAGCMSKTWNLAMQWAFREQDVDWLLCSMDDAVILPGWPEYLTRYDADLYEAPAGDISFLFNRVTLRKVGWFDERYQLIGWQEWDWYARAILALGLDRVVMEDDHGWVHNGIGLREVWHHYGNGMAQTTRRRDLDRFPIEWFMRKWGFEPDAMVRFLGAGKIPAPVEKEVEWYPWFKRD